MRFKTKLTPEVQASLEQTVLGGFQQGPNAAGRRRREEVAKANQAPGPPQAAPTAGTDGFEFLALAEEMCSVLVVPLRGQRMNAGIASSEW